MNTNILVFGASGRTGRNLVEQALALGYHVTAFVRNPSKLLFQHDHLDIHQGDVTDYKSVLQAMKGKNVVLSALGAASPFKLDHSIINGWENILKAMQEEQVNRLIYLSTVGVRESRKDAGLMIRLVAPRVLKTELKGHEIREQLIKKSNLSWTIVRAATLTSGNRKGSYRWGETIKSKTMVNTISRADVAELMIKQIADPGHSRKCISVMS